MLMIYQAAQLEGSVRNSYSTRVLQCLLGRYVSEKQNGARGCVIKTPLLFYVLCMWIFVPNSPLESSANDSAKAKYILHPLPALNIFIRNRYQKYDGTSAFGDRGINVTNHGVTSVRLHILFSTIYITVPRNLLKFSLKAGKHQQYLKLLSNNWDKPCILDKKNFEPNLPTLTTENKSQLYCIIILLRRRYKIFGRGRYRKT